MFINGHHASSNDAESDLPGVACEIPHSQCCGMSQEMLQFDPDFGLASP
jgi:hypothetical protein